MGQKIHPLGLRLNITQRHRSTWYAKTRHYPRLILEDQSIRQYLFKRYPKARISEIFITRDPFMYHKYKKFYFDPVRIRIYAEYPNLIASSPSLHRRRTLKRLAVDLERLYQKRKAPGFYKLLMYVSLRPVENLDTQASSIALKMIAQLKKRKPFRPLLKRALRLAKKSQIPGIKIQISGRLNGAEIARTEWVRHGRVPLHTLRANLDYCYKTVNTMYGVLGIKVWTFKPRQIWNYVKNDPEVRQSVRRQLARLILYKQKRGLETGLD